MNVCFCYVRFNFFSTSQESGLEECLQSDIFCIKRDVKPYVKLKLCVQSIVLPSCFNPVGVAETAVRTAVYHF